MKNSNFFEDVYNIVRQIPVGRVTTYGAIAEFLGSKSSARMVGWAMNHSFVYPDVPAHRVVNRKGVLTGKHHFPTPTAMQEALQKEGILIKDDCIQNFDAVFWHPKSLLEKEL